MSSVHESADFEKESIEETENARNAPTTQSPRKRSIKTQAKSFIANNNLVHGSDDDNDDDYRSYLNELLHKLKEEIEERKQKFKIKDIYRKQREKIVRRAKVNKEVYSSETKVNTKKKSIVSIKTTSPDETSKRKRQKCSVDSNVTGNNQEVHSLVDKTHNDSVNIENVSNTPKKKKKRAESHAIASQESDNKTLQRKDNKPSKSYINNDSGNKQVSAKNSNSIKEVSQTETAELYRSPNETIIGRSLDDDVEESECDKLSRTENESYSNLLGELEPKIYKLSKRLKEKFITLNINITWTLPILHAEKTARSHVKTKRMEKLGIEIKKAVFTKKEDDIIKANWKLFCETYDFDDPEPFLHYNHIQDYFAYDQYLQFLRFIARGIDDRCLYSVFIRFDMLVQGYIKGRYTETETDVLLAVSKKVDEEIVDQKKILKQLLHRERRCLSKKTSNMKMPQTEKIKLTDELKTTLIELLVEHMEVDSYEELEGKVITMDTWKVIESKMNVSSAKLLKFWTHTFHTQLFAKEPIYVQQVNAKVTDILCDMKATDWKEVNWYDVLKHFPGFTTLFLTTKLRSLIFKYVPKNIQEDVEATLKYIKANIYNFSKQNSCLKRYSFKDGTLITIYDNL